MALESNKSMRGMCDFAILSTGIVMRVLGRLSARCVPRGHGCGSQRSSRWQPEQWLLRGFALRQREQRPVEWQLELRRRATPSTSPGTAACAIIRAGIM